MSSERLLILTNRSWACSPRRPPIEARANPDLFHDAVMNFMEIQTGRTLADQEVREINLILKRRAYRYIAAGREEWLYPERHVRGWRELGGGHLLMPDPRPLNPGAEIVLAFSDGSFETRDTLGRPPTDRRFGHEARDAAERAAHNRWCEEFERLVGSQRRGLSWHYKLRTQGSVAPGKNA